MRLTDDAVVRALGAGRVCSRPLPGDGTRYVWRGAGGFLEARTVEDGDMTSEGAPAPVTEINVKEEYGGAGGGNPLELEDLRSDGWTICCAGRVSKARTREDRRRIPLVLRPIYLIKMEAEANDFQSPAEARRIMEDLLESIRRGEFQ